MAALSTVAAVIGAATGVATAVKSHQVAQDAKGEAGRQRREQAAREKELKDRQAYQDKGEKDTILRNQERAKQRAIQSGESKDTFLTNSYAPATSSLGSSGGKTLLGQ